MSPEGVVTSLSRYFERMSTAIHDTNGIVDKFIGDAIMAIWNAPLEDSDHVRHGCETLLNCLRIDKSLAIEFEQAGITPFFTRFGLHTGDAVVGNVGSSELEQALWNAGSRFQRCGRPGGRYFPFSVYRQSRSRWRHPPPGDIRADRQSRSRLACRRHTGNDRRCRNMVRLSKPF
ncbi:MAG: adenylate/guanylate cyclase domain-containing protein [Alphaproteobacteria bacterium]